MGSSLSFLSLCVLSFLLGTVMLYERRQKKFYFAFSVSGVTIFFFYRRGHIKAILNSTRSVQRQLCINPCVFCMDKFYYQFHENYTRTPSVVRLTSEMRVSEWENVTVPMHTLISCRKVTLGDARISPGVYFWFDERFYSFFCTRRPQKKAKSADFNIKKRGASVNRAFICPVYDFLSPWLHFLFGSSKPKLSNGKS